MATSTTTRKPHQRYHLANGDQVPGVTTVLGVINKPALVPWANKLGRDGVSVAERLAYLADAWTLAHSLIESSLTGITRVISGYSPDQHQLARNALASFHAWARGKRLETHQVELSLVSEAHGYGGTCDWLGLVNGTLTVADWKTSSSVYDDHLFQASAYRQLLHEAGHDVGEVRVVALPRDEGSAFTERVLRGPDIAPYWEVFKAALALHQAIAATKPPKRRRRTRLTNETSLAVSR